jgi:hypothetical protein
MTPNLLTRLGTITGWLRSLSAAYTVIFRRESFQEVAQPENACKRIFQRASIGWTGKHALISTIPVVEPGINQTLQS